MGQIRYGISTKILREKGKRQLREAVTKLSKS